MKKRLLSILMSACMLTLALCFPATAQAASIDHFQKTNTYVTGQYSDVPGSHTFSENVRAGYEYGIMKGYGSTFGVANSITRMASIIVACRLNSIYETGANDIEQRYTGTTQEIYLQYAVDHDILCNFQDPSLPASRAEFAAILSSSLPDEALSAINQVEENAIPDVSYTSDYGSEIYRLYRAGILNGSDAKGTFYPTAKITRGAACAIATRMCSPDLRKNVTLTVQQPTPDVPPFNLSKVPAYSGDPYYVVNGNIPYFSATEKNQSTSFEHYAPLDHFGRCGVTVASIGPDLMPTEERGSIGQIKPSGWHTIKYDCVDGKYLYNRCHLIGFQLTAENANPSNLITGTRYLNIEGMLPFENMVADYIKETGNHVYYRSTPIFEGNNLLASGVLMEAWSVEDNGAGICFNVFCYNVQPGIIIDYATGDSTSDCPATVPDPKPVPDPIPVPNPGQGMAGDYILNTNTHKFHYPTCRSVKRMSEANKQYYHGSRDNLIAKGYGPCGICNP